MKDRSRDSVPRHRPGRPLPPRPHRSPVKIGVIGAGHVGGTLAARLVAAGHEVAISNSRGPETLQGVVDGARPMTVEDAARFGEVVVVSVFTSAFLLQPEKNTMQAANARHGARKRFIVQGP